MSTAPPPRKPIEPELRGAGAVARRPAIETDDLDADSMPVPPGSRGPAKLDLPGWDLTPPSGTDPVPKARGVS